MNSRWHWNTWMDQNRHKTEKCSATRQFEIKPHQAGTIDKQAFTTHCWSISAVQIWIKVQQKSSSSGPRGPVDPRQNHSRSKTWWKSFSCCYLSENVTNWKKNNIKLKQSFLRWLLNSDRLIDTSSDQVWASMPALSPATANEWWGGQETRPLSSYSSLLSHWHVSLQMIDTSCSQWDSRSLNKSL